MKITEAQLRNTVRRLIREQIEWAGEYNFAGSPGEAIHSLAPHGSDDGFVSWADAERETGVSRQEMIDYIDNQASDSELYYMKYNDEGLDLDDPMSV